MKPRVCPHCEKRLSDILRIEGIDPVCPYCDEHIHFDFLQEKEKGQL